MSAPHVVVAAVHNPEGSIEEWWKEHKQKLDDFKEARDHNDEIEWHMCEGKFKSAEARETYEVRSEYHSGRGERVIEVIISGRKDVQDVQETGLEDIVDEVNYRMGCDFTLEVYYWYDGVDKPGGVPR